MARFLVIEVQDEEVNVTEFTDVDKAQKVWVGAMRDLGYDVQDDATPTEYRYFDDPGYAVWLLDEADIVKG
jgi:hypothetical protein